MWKCPKCKREFRNRNQDHSCGEFSVEKVFEKYPDNLQLYQIIHKEISKLGDIQISPVKNGVMFSVNTTFLAIKPHSKYLGVEFSSYFAHDEFPVEKCFQISKSKFAHILKIDSPENIDKQLINWIKEAYESDITKKT